jgi:hypothetical protein
MRWAGNVVRIGIGMHIIYWWKTQKDKGHLLDITILKFQYKYYMEVLKHQSEILIL